MRGIQGAIEPNPLYSQGMDRVGCFPCINSGKETIRAWALRWPEHVTRIEEWEAAVGMASKRGGSSFFPAPEDGRGDLMGRNITKVIQWSKTARGGKQMDLLAVNEDSEACSSSYGLCETAS